MIIRLPIPEIAPAAPIRRQPFIATIMPIAPKTSLPGPRRWRSRKVRG
jgi:hypothetical protein